MRSRELLSRVRERKEALKAEIGIRLAQVGELERLEKLLVMRPKAKLEDGMADRAEQMLVNPNPTP